MMLHKYHSFPLLTPSRTAIFRPWRVLEKQHSDRVYTKRTSILEGI